MERKPFYPIIRTGNHRKGHAIQPQPHGGDDLEQLIVASLEDDKAEDVAIVDLAGKTSFADKMIIATGRSQRHVGSIADHVVEKLKAIGHSRVGIEGKESCDWVLIDAGDIIVHVFRPEIRDLYDLERMWMIAPVEPPAADSGSLH